MSEIKFGFTVKQLVDEGRVVAEDIDKLRSWAPTQNLPKLTDEQIAIFLISCFGDLEASKKTIKAFFTIKINCPKLFDDWNLEREDLRKQLKTCEICVMPERRSDGCAVLLARLQDFYFGNCEMAPANALLNMTLETMLHDNPPAGLVVIVDNNGLGLMHLTKMRMDILQTSFKYLQEGLPVPLKEIHSLNVVYFMDKIKALIKPFICKKVWDMLHFHQCNMDMEEFYKKWIPKRCLPEDYGGDLPPVRVLHERNTKKLIQMQPYFKATELQRHSIKYLLRSRFL